MALQASRLVVNSPNVVYAHLSSYIIPVRPTRPSGDGPALPEASCRSLEGEWKDASKLGLLLVTSLLPYT